jgi:hypothetical protein
MHRIPTGEKEFPGRSLVSQLRSYFEAASGVAPHERRLGVEVETLFLRRPSKPLTVDDAERVFLVLERQGWEQRHDPKDVGRALHRGAFTLKPEVGAGNIELISPPRPVDQLAPLIDDVHAQLALLYTAAEEAGATPIFAPHDGFGEVDNILLQNERDRKWLSVDGRAALCRLGHIASVHLTVDLVSIDEGFAFIRELNALARERGWPPAPVLETWTRYLESSHRNYHPRRFGEAPESFEAYLALLERFKVVVDRAPDGHLIHHEHPVAFADYDGDVDLDTFLGTVWFHTRLRRLAGQLALEVRFVPRGSDGALRENLRAVMACLKRVDSAI